MEEGESRFSDWCKFCRLSHSLCPNPEPLSMRTNAGPPNSGLMPCTVLWSSTSANSEAPPSSAFCNASLNSCPPG